ncbi:hypothetical protein [Deinococcus aquaticus]|uniref:Uncharacterized protein n=1 Tax=Deinococcus aquaticus TaxID=328692 RepID=A0ABY7V6P5_9DEIO|nr:hypothetical protein [Deinococcus aquaticus]WDA60410.1 hypothetical protein M8445_15460 [Deinococcus aquaticus]
MEERSFEFLIQDAENGWFEWSPARYPELLRLPQTPSADGPGPGHSLQVDDASLRFYDEMVGIQVIVSGNVTYERAHALVTEVADHLVRLTQQSVTVFEVEVEFKGRPVRFVSQEE